MGIFNKAAGIFGILSIFTGHPISAVEWVMNILQILLLPLFIMAFINIKKKNALRILVFAYIYILDSVAMFAFTIYFIVHWFTAGAREAASNAPSPTATAAITSLADLGAQPTTTTMPHHEAWPVATPMPDIYRRDELVGQDGVATSATAGAAGAGAVAMQSSGSSAGSSGVNQSASLGQEIAVTIVLTVFVMLVRLYFTLVIVGYARQLVRVHNLRSTNGYPKGSRSAKLQYWLIHPMEKFWTGAGPRKSHGLIDEASERLTSPLFNRSACC
jgi:hypothetical protein